MAESVKALPTELNDMMDVKEWDMRTREGIARFKELRAKMLPSIAMDGELVYESIIPGQEELMAEIKRRFFGKRRSDQDEPRLTE
jgi:hypothetical protein